MPVKNCAICKKPAYASSRGTGKEYWVCSDCRMRVDSSIELAASSDNILLTRSNICDKCRKRSGNCRFTESERSKITACSDWESKDTERNRRRWAKFE